MARRNDKQNTQSGVGLSAIGSNGSIGLYAHKVVISRPKGGCLNPFAGSGEKHIMLADITSIEFRSPEKKHEAGYIQFAFRGGQESKAIGGQVTSDENTVMFGYKQAAMFRAMHHAVEQKMLEHRTSPAIGTPQQVSGADELAKLADLRDRGIINEQEFEIQSGESSTNNGIHLT